MSHAIFTAILVTSIYPSCDPNASPYQQNDAFRPAQIVVYESPCYDCYSRNALQLGCYPTFYQRNYRRPYNYRTLFDYPWHAEVYRSGCGDFGQSVEVRVDDLESDDTHNVDSAKRSDVRDTDVGKPSGGLPERLQRLQFIERRSATNMPARSGQRSQTQQSSLMRSRNATKSRVVDPRIKRLGVSR